VADCAVLKASKGSIYSLHRGDVAKAQELLRGAKATIQTELLPISAAFPSLRYSLGGALEEYAEAVIFTEYLASGRIPKLAELEFCSRDEYLGGLMDAVGELNRFAVLRATTRDIAAVTRARDLVDALHHNLMLFDWRNGNLRRKFDGVSTVAIASPACLCFAPTSISFDVCRLSTRSRNCELHDAEEVLVRLGVTRATPCFLRAPWLQGADHV